MGTAESFVRLFRGRADAYGSWEGGCVHRALTREHFTAHLFSHDPDSWIGVYNVVDTRCSWGCVDIDTDDRPLALNVRTALAAEHIPAWVEKTTRGYHVWVFPADYLVQARTMRRALAAACRVINYDPREIFPKQDKALGWNLGNYVRLPYNGALANPAPRDCRRFIHEHVTLEDIDRERTATSDLERVASYLPDPQPVDIPVDFKSGLDVEPEVRRIGSIVWVLWRDGPLHGHDRSSTLVRLAHELAQRDVSADLAYAIVASADNRWGKRFLERGEPGEQILQRIVAKAYGASASGRDR